MGPLTYIVIVFGEFFEPPTYQYLLVNIYVTAFSVHKVKENFWTTYPPLCPYVIVKTYIKFNIIEKGCLGYICYFWRALIHSGVPLSYPGVPESGNLRCQRAYQNYRLSFSKILQLTFLHCRRN